MYYRDRETKASEAFAHNKRQREAAKDRLKNNAAWNKKHKSKS